jgi:hypothetical protein
MKTAFSSSEGCTVVRRGRKNVEKRKTMMGMGAAHPKKQRETGCALRQHPVFLTLICFSFRSSRNTTAPGIVIFRWI